MAVIDPFAFTPAGPFSRIHAYFFATWMRCQYASDAGRADLDNVIRDAMGATSLEVIPHSFEGIYVYPRTDLAILPDGRRVVMIRGTTEFPQELAFEIQGATLVSRPPWPGLVGDYFFHVAQVTRDRIIDPLTTWMAAGHSLGGAIAGIMSFLGAERVYTIGSPKEGNAAYADARGATPKLRLTTADDPVPLIPFQTNTSMDYFTITPPTFLLSSAFRHWGRRHFVQIDGTVLLPPDDEQWLGPATVEVARQLILGGYVFHQPQTYAFRLRQGIPIAFPAAHDDKDFPQLVELDSLNSVRNIEQNIPQWQIDGRPRPIIDYARRRPVPPGKPPNTDPVQFLCE